MKPGVDLFAGLGGFSEGARLSGRVSVKFAANHWPAAVQWHSTNHPETHHECQDLAQIDMRVLPDIRDGILLAAPACQGFSQCGQPAGKGAGGSHSPDAGKLKMKHQADRNSAWAVLAACDSARPASLIVENVPDFMRWELFDAWCGVLKTMGYHLTVEALDARDFGVPQDRKRMILTGSLSGPRPIQKATRTTGTIGSCLDPVASREHRWATIASKPPRTRNGLLEAQAQVGPVCFWNNVSERRGRSLDQTWPTITTKSGSQMYITDGNRCRIVNPREIARAQGFGAHYQLPKNRELAGKMIGNAFPPMMAREVITQVVD